MARIRTIKPEFFHDEDLAKLENKAKLAFIGLWCYADREGRLEDRPEYLKAMIFPYEAINMDEVLNTLAPKFIVRYKVENKLYIQVKNFLKHQCPNTKELPSKIPSESDGTLQNIPKHSEMLRHRGKGNMEREYETTTSDKFKKPTAEEATAYAKSLDFQLDGQQFVDFYETRGWLVGKNKIKSWEACVRTWKRRAEEAAKNRKAIADMMNIKAVD